MMEESEVVSDYGDEYKIGMITLLQVSMVSDVIMTAQTQHNIDAMLVVLTTSVIMSSPYQLFKFSFRGEHA